MEIIDFMKDPQSYDEITDKVEYKQTHISHVFLIKDYVYKIKKPVNFGFLDFSTIEKRKAFCEEEVRLNKRLCPDLYLGVVPITMEEEEDDALVIDGDGEIVEYAVKMKRMPEEAIMSNVLKDGKLTKSHLKTISKKLSEYYKESPQNDTIRAFGKVENIKKKTDENFEQTEKYVGNLFEEEKYNYIKEATNTFFEKNKELFEQRIKDGKTVAFHGDLHTGNIFVTDKDINIFDCIEFNKPFRMGDVAEDISFLAMDLDFIDHQYFSKYLISKYVDYSGDYLIYSLLDFYKCYRAYVRAKVSGFMLDDPSFPEDQKKELKASAQKYFNMAYDYAMTFNNQKPTLIIGSGLSGTGKSRWVKVAADIVNASILKTDAVRKKALGIPENQCIKDEYGKGYYSKENRDKVYDYIFNEVDKILSLGGKVVFDAAFLKKDMRKRAKEIAMKNNAEFIIVTTDASDNTIEERIKIRSKQQCNDSDANFAIYLKQKDIFEKPTEEEGFLIAVDTEKEEYENLKIVSKKIWDLLQMKYTIKFKNN